MNQLNALLSKELKEAFRDKRALLVGLMMALMIPVVIFAMSKIMIKEAVATPPIYIKITGGQHAPKLFEQLNKENILPFEQAPENKKAIWDERNVLLTIPEDFNHKLFNGEPIEITLKADFSEKALAAPLRRIKHQINAYSQSIGYQRLMFRGIDVKLVQPVVLVEQNTAPPSSNAKVVTMMLGIYLLMAAFLSGLSVAIDSSAGERERNVLEMLLCQPVDTSKIIIAKLICASLIAIIGVVLTLSLTSFAVSFIDLSVIGASFNLDAFTVISLLIILIPICFFASALQLFVAFQSKSFKEAQSTVSMVIMLPAMVPMALMMINDKPKWVDWLPIAGQSLLMEELFKGVEVNFSIMAFTSLVTLAATVILVYAMANKLKSEKAILSL